MNPHPPKPTATAPPVTGGPLRSAFADDQDMREIVEVFVSEMPQKVEALAALWREQKLDDLRRLAHQLKGAGGGYGFPTVGQAAGDLEQSIDAMGHGSAARVDELRRRFDELSRLCRSVSM